MEDVEAIEAPDIPAALGIMQTVRGIYTDGGVIRRNPSPIGGTWAWVAVNSLDDIVAQASGVVPAPLNIGNVYTKQLESRSVSNNVMEFWAVVEALEFLPFGWSGYVYSDSLITLNRVFGNTAWTMLPPDLTKRCYRALTRMGSITPVLVSGHPTRAELRAGYTLDGKRRPVSYRNVLCDKLCREAGEAYLKQLAQDGKKGVSNA